VSFDLAERALNVRLLDTSDGSFALDRAVSEVLNGKGVRLTYWSDPHLESTIVIVQALESSGLPVPPPASDAIKIGPFEAKTWVDANGLITALFPTGASSPTGENVFALVFSSDRPVLERFIRSLHFAR
jgi:hypothetical protein